METLAIPQSTHSARSNPVERATLPFTSWAEFRAEHFDWKQGEHISLIGPTGQGKTTTGIDLLNERAYVIALGTKPADETLERLITEKGFLRVKRLPLHPVELAPRQLFWPKTETVEDVTRHRAAFRALLAEVYAQGGWTIFPDELRYFTDGRYLGLSSLLELFYLQGRSLKASVVGGFQRPAYVPLVAYDQPTHLFLWRNSDEANMRRLREISGGFDVREIRREILALDAMNHEVLYVNTRNGKLVKTRTEV